MVVVRLVAERPFEGLRSYRQSSGWTQAIVEKITEDRRPARPRWSGRLPVRCGTMAGDEGDGVLRARVRAAVLARTPVDERERVSIERFIELFDALDRPFEESADPVHVTGSAIVMGPRGVVLLRHKRLGIWLQPGGHVDPGETPWEAALREAQEETGLVVSPLSTPPSLAHVDVHPGPRGHTHLDLRYLVDGGDADPDPPSDESQEIAWFGWDDAITLADEGLRGALVALRPS
jgi:8-oxo-dGTP pyrophosphatase MutT (NUDIX family)